MSLDPISQDLEYLTGPEAAGRLSGTEGARRASAYLAVALGALGLTPAGEDGYFQWLELPAARVTGPVRLTVGSDSYRYRKDFSEITYLSAGGSVKAPLVVVTEEEQHRPDDLRGKVALIPKRPEGFDLGLHDQGRRGYDYLVGPSPGGRSRSGAIRYTLQGGLHHV